MLKTFQFYCSLVYHCKLWVNQVNFHRSHSKGQKEKVRGYICWGPVILSHHYCTFKNPPSNLGKWILFQLYILRTLELYVNHPPIKLIYKKTLSIRKVKELAQDLQLWNDGMGFEPSWSLSTSCLPALNTR